MEQHLLDAEQAAADLFRAETRWGDSWPRFFKLHADQHGAAMLNLRLAALFHDIGKANEQFQARLAGARELDTIRHKHLSALVISLPQVRAWLAGAAGVDADVICAAVLSHHFKAAEEAFLLGMRAARQFGRAVARDFGRKAPLLATKAGLTSSASRMRRGMRPTGVSSPQEER